MTFKMINRINKNLEIPYLLSVLRFTLPDLPFEFVTNLATSDYATKEMGGSY